MKKTIRALAAMATLSLLVATAAWAEFGITTTFTRQAGGSNGDSTAAAADTSDPIRLSKNLKDWVIFSYCDSGSTDVTIQASHDSTLWATIYVDSMFNLATTFVGPMADTNTAAGDNRFQDEWIRVITETREANPLAAKTVTRLYQVAYR
jgi:hypothetical protein